MYPVWRCVRAMSNASSSAARYVLTLWFPLQPSTGFIRFKHACFFPHHQLETSTFSGVSLKTLLVLIHRRILRPSHSAAWRISGSPKLIIASRNGLRRPSSLRPATAREQYSVGRRFGQPQTDGPDQACSSLRFSPIHRTKVIKRSPATKQPLTSWKTACWPKGKQERHQCISLISFWFLVHVV